MAVWDDLVESCRDAVGKDVNDLNDVADVVDELNREVCRLKGELRKLHQPTVIGCLHPFNDVVSGNDGDFCCKCQSYLKSNRL